ncbi:two-component system response regulator [Agromyces sp. Root1464]|uniref:response regulator transcription factor n=1 Tax=Agromyces sp. Root1464 TaxID=1736467 RepID=UPI0006FEF04D|nr:response regulator transcription factor [Agromyces sp. Root1464]KQZ09320.1 two-component system response regulator [Agromyces sp. Root1464]
MALVLVVDDDTTVAEVVVAYLERAGIEVESVVDGTAALEAASRSAPDAVVLDLMLPGIDGIEVCRRLRAERPHLPVLMLTARGEEDDRVLGLEAGADDYIVKPFSPRELVLRVQAVLRRTAGPAGAAGAAADGRSGVLEDEGVSLDPVAHRAWCDGRELQLTVREFDLLHWFLSHPGAVHDRETLLREVWGWEVGDLSTVTVHVRRLREKIEADAADPQRIVTVFGVGYRWDGGA